MRGCLADATELLEETGLLSAVTPRNVLHFAVVLAERRIVHASRIYDEYLR